MTLWNASFYVILRTVWKGLRNQGNYYLLSTWYPHRHTLSKETHKTVNFISWKKWSKSLSVTCRGSLPPSFVQQEGLPTSCPICFEEYTGKSTFHILLSYLYIDLKSFAQSVRIIYIGKGVMLSEKWFAFSISENVEEIFIGFIKPCKHFYHFDCIWQWLENRGNCPLCREKVKYSVPHK